MNSVQANLPVELHRELIANEIVSIVEPKCKEGNVSLNELAIINGIILKEKPLRIFEIGTFDGRTTVNMAANSPDESVIFTIDLNKEDVFKTKFQLDEGDKYLSINKGIIGQKFTNPNQPGHVYINKIRQLYGDSATFNFTPYYNSIDLVFIDAAHTYDYVINDTNVALRLLKNQKGILLWHDYAIHPDVTEAVEAIGRNRKDLNILHIKDSTLAYVKIQ